jgi:hypothetical protein
MPEETMHENSFGHAAIIEELRAYLCAPIPMASIHIYSARRTEIGSAFVARLAGP